MGKFAVGDVVLVPFPYADFTKFKKRPALIIGFSEFNNIILCQITSKAQTSKRAVKLLKTDFSAGNLPIDSYIRQDKIFTIEQSIIERKIGSLNSSKIKNVLFEVRQLFING